VRNIPKATTNKLAKAGKQPLLCSPDLPHALLVSLFQHEAMQHQAYMSLNHIRMTRSVFDLAGDKTIPKR